MSKIICEVCGTSYPETMAHCPICGCVRPGDGQNVVSDPAESDAIGNEGYSYAKGGHFSKSNVRKRNRTAQQPNQDYPVSEENEPREGSGINRGLTVVAVVLLLAIIAVVIFIAIRFFAPQTPPNIGETQQTTQQPTLPEESTGPVTIPCDELELSATEAELTTVGQSYMIQVTPFPADTTDVVTFLSSNPAVATVTAAGEVVAVASGEAVITITCGDAHAQLHVTCSIEPEETEPPVIDPTDPVETLLLNRSDITFFYAGETWVLYNGNIPVEDITWSSDNEAIVTFVNGKAVAIGSGTTNIHAEYMGQKVSCIIRCNFSSGSNDDPIIDGNGGVTEEGGFKAPYTLKNTYGMTDRDSTIAVGESFSLYLVDAEGKNVPLTWTAEDGAVCTVSSNKITGQSAGVTKVKAEFGGVTYFWTVRVKS